MFKWKGGDSFLMKQNPTPKPNQNKNAPRNGSGKPKRPGAFTSFRNVLGIIWRGIATVIMVGIITGCIVACIMTVYILRYIGADDEISLESVKLGYTSIVYATDSKTGETIELQRLYRGGENRIWVDYEQMNEYTKDAIVAIEDKRFWQHSGVDWKRTVAAGLNLFVPLSGTNAGGGSTITQQLIKNITQDDDYRIERKVREIFRALNLSKRYSREQILEAYLNVVPFGNGTNGIQSAANLYFNKDAKDLTLAESAAIVGITQYPGLYDPFVNPDQNKKRREHILDEMLDQEKITQAEYNKAMTQILDFKGEQHFEAIKTTQSYFVDHVINEVISDLMEEKGYTYNYASDQLLGSGFRIYTTVDPDIQKHLEEIYSSSDNFPTVYNQTYPQSASVITDPNGKILAMVGGIGEKEGARILNRATQSKRQPGSSIKPLAAYAMAFEYNKATWSTKFDDSPIMLEQPGGTTTAWPRNYYGRYDGMMTVDEAIQRSTNTIPVKLVQAIGEKRVFDFLTQDLHFHSLIERETVGNAVMSDVNLSSMALGGMTYGVTPLEMAGGYQIYNNGGQFTEPYSYTKVLDSQGRTILEKDLTPRTALSRDTAVIINKLLQRVVNGPRGTGVAANLGNMPTAGKTGTSSEDVDQWFIGMSPYYVCQVWLGYDHQTYVDKNGYTRTNTINYGGSYPPPILFKTIMQPLHEGLEVKSFPESDAVVSLQYCTITGDQAAETCTSRGTGWYKKSQPLRMCTGHAIVEEKPENADTSTASDSNNDSDDEPGIFDRLRDNNTDEDRVARP